MAFETRKVGGPEYLYLSARDPSTGKVKKRYMGTGPKAEAAAAALEARQKRRVDERLALGRVRRELGAVDALMAELDAGATLVMEAALFAAGFNRPNYGPWRKRRH